MQDKQYIRVVNSHNQDIQLFLKQYTDCIILTDDHQILLQQRGKNWDRYPGFLAAFGGEIEKGETPAEGLVRELQEELGAVVSFDDLIHLGAVTEAITDFKELLHVYFWHDKNHRITGCYEGECRYFANVKSALLQPAMMDDVCWALTECVKRGLLK